MGAGISKNEKIKFILYFLYRLNYHDLTPWILLGSARGGNGTFLFFVIKHVIHHSFTF